MKKVLHHGWLRIAIPGSGVLAIGGCDPLSDAQLTQILTSFISTALNSAVTTFITNLLGAGAAAA